MVRQQSIKMNGLRRIPGNALYVSVRPDHARKKRQKNSQLTNSALRPMPPTRLSCPRIRHFGCIGVSTRGANPRTGLKGPRGVSLSRDGSQNVSTPTSFCGFPSETPGQCIKDWLESSVLNTIHSTATPERSLISGGTRRCPTCPVYRRPRHTLQNL